jgi:hypothetical protein
MENVIQKNFDELNIESVMSYELHYNLIKIWGGVKEKNNYKTKKLSSDDIDDLRDQNSDNESDKTQYEKNCPSNTCRKANSVISNNYSRKYKSTNTSNSSSKFYKKGVYTSKSIYQKRRKSIDYVKNYDNDENTYYNIVLTYLKI